MQGIFGGPRRPPHQDFFYKVLVGSLAAHLAFFAFGLFIHAPGVRRTFFAPVYTVTLVEPRAPAKRPAARKKAVKKAVKTRTKKTVTPRKRAKETVTVKKAKKTPAAAPAAPARKETVSLERALAGIKERVEKKEAEELVARRIEELKEKQARESEAVERSIEELKKSIAAMGEPPSAPPAPEVAEEAAPAAAPSGRITMENLKAEYPEYYRAIRDRVWENWIYPMDLGGKDVEVIIAIKIGRSGELLDREIEKSSGNRILDQSLVGAIMKAAPFPPLPEGMAGEYLDTGLRFCPGCAGK
ncbi:MAG: TonB family protein [Thermodesulfobacteriota bacterium]